MDQPIQVLAGTGGVALGEARTNHEGRKAVLLHREGDPRELIALAETMGMISLTYSSKKEMTTPGRILERADCKMLQTKFLALSKDILGMA